MANSPSDSWLLDLSSGVPSSGTGSQSWIAVSWELHPGPLDTTLVLTPDASLTMRDPGGGRETATSGGLNPGQAWPQEVYLQKQ